MIKRFHNAKISVNSVIALIVKSTRFDIGKGWIFKKNVVVDFFDTAKRFKNPFEQHRWKIYFETLLIEE